MDIDGFKGKKGSAKVVLATSKVRKAKAKVKARRARETIPMSTVTMQQWKKAKVNVRKKESGNFVVSMPWCVGLVERVDMLHRSVLRVA